MPHEPNYIATTFHSPIAFCQTPIRALKINGKPWFVAADLAEVLGFKTTAGAGWYARHLDPEERNTITLTTGVRGNPQKTIVSESGLYKLVMRSDKPEAKPFQDWVTKVVLPAIRKDGMFVMGEEKVVTGEMSEDELILRAYDALRRKVAQSATA